MIIEAFGKQIPLEIQEVQPSRRLYLECAADLCREEICRDLDTLSGSSVYLVLRTDDELDRVAGMSQLAGTGEGENRTLYISRLAVPSKLQGLGIGSWLITHAVELAQQQEYETISVEPTNMRNRKFYEMHGFQHDQLRSKDWRQRWLFRDLNTVVK